MFGLAAARLCLDTGMAPVMQVYKLPDGAFESVATRFTLPVRALSYSPSGTNLAAAGDDDGIKLISAAESKVSAS